MKATVTPGKPRIPYIDFMKGLCIMLIVMTHVEGTFFDQLLPNLNNALQSFRIPLYYFLSGLFFKTYGGISDFSRKKVNNLLIPFVFFHVLCCATTLIIFELKEHFVRPQEIKFVWTCFIEPLYLRDWHYTVPLWFLLSLFEVNIIYYCLQRWLRPWAVMSIVALVLHDVIPDKALDDPEARRLEILWLAYEDAHRSVVDPASEITECIVVLLRVIAVDDIVTLVESLEKLRQLGRVRLHVVIHRDKDIAFRIVETCHHGIVLS